MALFSTKKKTDAKPAAAPVQTTASGVRGSLAHVLTNPRITEKASMHQGIGVYTFDVSMRSTKTQIAQAIQEVYKVTPRKIAVVMIPSKQTRSMKNGRRGEKSGGKKAYVYLKSGESITIA
jgi:ribosomal protein L23